MLGWFLSCGIWFLSVPRKYIVIRPDHAWHGEPVCHLMKQVIRSRALAKASLFLFLHTSFLSVFCSIKNWSETSPTILCEKILLSSTVSHRWNGWCCHHPQHTLSHPALFSSKIFCEHLTYYNYFICLLPFSSTECDHHPKGMCSCLVLNHLCLNAYRVNIWNYSWKKKISAGISLIENHPYRFMNENHNRYYQSLYSHWPNENQTSPDVVITPYMHVSALV